MERRASIRGRILYLDAYSLFADRHYAEALEQILKACELDEHSINNFDLAAKCKGDEKTAELQKLILQALQDLVIVSGFWPAYVTVLLILESVTIFGNHFSSQLICKLSRPID